MEEKNVWSIEIKDKEKGEIYFESISLWFFILQRKDKEKSFSYGKADYRVFLGIQNRDILVMPLSLYPHILCGYVVYDSSIS